MQASTPMTRRIVAVPPEMPLDGAWRIMKRERIRHLPVVQRGVLLGILSDRDILLRATLVGEVVEVPSAPVGTAMTYEPVTCEADTPVPQLVRLMTERKIDALPVVACSGRLVGLVTSTDLLLLLVRNEDARPLPFEYEVHEAAEGEAPA